MYRTSKALPALLFFGLAVLISACSSQQVSKNQAPQTSSVSSHQNPETLLAIAAQSSNKGAASVYLLKAAQLYWEGNLFSQAKAALAQVDHRSLLDQQWQAYWMLRLTMALQEENTLQLEEIIPVVHSPNFFQQEWTEQRKLVTELERAYELSARPLDAAMILIEYSSLFEDPDLINEQIWKHLKNADLTLLSTFEYAGEHYDTQGWLSLARSIRLNSLRLQEQYFALRDWLDAWSFHPAAIDLPKELELLSQLPESQPKNIVLALPFSGPLAPVSHAIRDGLLASFYASTTNKNASTQDTPTDLPGAPINISTYDTFENSFSALYDGRLPESSIIIGPLQKEILSDLTRADSLPIKTLALNYVPTERHVENLFQFSLNPEGETLQVAQRMQEEGFNRIGILAPESEWGLRIYDSFNAANTELDITLIESAFYSDQKSLSQAVAKVLATDLSRSRARTVREITGLGVESTPRRREDIDAVFMVARSEIAKQLKPLLAYHYAGDLPVFSTSQINDLKRDDNQRDLNGIKFVDMPWSLSSTVALRHMLEQEFPQNAARYSRFYAMGVDAFQITPRLDLLSQIEGSHIEGQTGDLSISEDNIIQRKLQWAQFRSGKPVVIN